MNAFDILIIVILGFCMVRGIFRGLVKELTSIVGVLGGFYAAYTYYDRLALILSKFISETGYLNILSFLIIFCATLIIISLLGLIIKYLLNIVYLGWIDRVAGSLFATVKGILIASILLITFTAFLDKGSPLVKNSILSPYIMSFSEKIAIIASKNLKEKFSINIKELEKTWKSTR